MMSDNKKNPPSTDVRNPFGELIGLKFVKWSGGSSRCTLEVVENLRNPNGVVHGGVLYSMADTGMGAAIYHNLEQGQTCATLEIKIQY